MDRVAAMVVLFLGLFSLILVVMALFAYAPIICTCIGSLIYSLYLFMAYEESGVHHAQEFENRFWTIFGLLLSTALLFAKDSPLAFGQRYPSLGFGSVLLSGYLMHLWDRHHHRLAISRATSLRRTSTASTSLTTLKHLGIPVEDQLAKINQCLQDIDRRLVPSTINNFINLRTVLNTEREVISIFEECDARALNYLVNHSQLALLFYKIKDHKRFAGQHRTQVVQLLAFDRLAILTVMSRVIVLHSLQVLKLKANPKAEFWVKNIIVNTHQDELSQLKTLMDAKGDYQTMSKLIFEDLSSETIRHDILSHIRKEAAVQQAHMQMGTKHAKKRRQMASWRKVLSDVDDTLLSSGGSYPAGIDKRYCKKVVYPGVLAFYRELDLGTEGPEEWPEHRVGNLVFLSARPHVYKDMSEKANFLKFEKLRSMGEGRQGLHTVPSLLPGDLQSGTNYIVSNDFGHLANKKFDNFQRYVSIYPEYKHVFVCDNGQGDVRAAEMMFDKFPYELEAVYVHVVQDRTKTYGYDLEQYRQKEFSPCFFTTYPEAALHAASEANPPLITPRGLWRVCRDAVKDFESIPESKWTNPRTKAERRMELNQAIWRANFFLKSKGIEEVPLIEAEQIWEDGTKVTTPYGICRIRGFDPSNNLYKCELDWRPLNVQLAEHLTEERNETVLPRISNVTSAGNDTSSSKLTLETVVEIEEVDDDGLLLQRKISDGANGSSASQQSPSRQDVQQALVKLPAADGEDVSANGADGNEGEASSKAESESEKSENNEELKIITTKTQNAAASCKVILHIAGHCITNYSPPSLPKLDKTRGSIFTFWAPSGKTKSTTPKKAIIDRGAQCTTPYGAATIVEHRQKEKLVVVSMVGWRAIACLREEDVEVVAKGLFKSFFRSLSGVEGSSAAASRNKDFPYAKGTVIKTPYGEGLVSIPLPPEQRETEKLTVDKKSSSSSQSTSSTSTAPSKKSPKNARTTIGISITSWKLAGGSHPTVYCTVEQARKWKDGKEGDGKGLLSSAIETLVSSSKQTLLPLFSPKIPVPKKEEATPKEEQYFQDAAAVVTHYGDGVVSDFRPEDGFYKVALCNWTLSDGSHPVAYLKKEDMSCRVAKGCMEGYPVTTNLGLTGTLASVVPTTGVHVVTIQSAGIVCYLQPESVIRPIKAAVGEEVMTAYGEGFVEHYRLKDNTYVIQLNQWRGAKLYAKAETFDRVNDGMQDVGSFGMKWLMDIFFSTGSKATAATRSRSNSITSGRSTRAS